MSTEKLQKTNLKDKIKNFVSNHRIWTGLIALVLLFGIYWLVSVAQERYRFSKAEKELTTLSEEISASLGQKFEKERSCRYASAKFEKGQLRCGVSFFIKFTNTDKTKANELLARLYSTASSSNTFPHKKVGVDTSLKNLPDNPYVYQKQSKEIRLNSDGKYPSCTAGAEFNPNELSISLICAGETKREYFPVKD